jgi:hypothetical protein
MMIRQLHEALVWIAMSLPVGDRVGVKLLRAAVQDLSLKELLVGLTSASEVLVRALEMFAYAMSLVHARAVALHFRSVVRFSVLG